MFTWHVKTTSGPDPEPTVTTPIPNKKSVSELTMVLASRGRMSWTKDADEARGASAHWQDFYKWFFSREQSKYYVMRYITGETMVLRDDIKSFDVVLKDKPQT